MADFNVNLIRDMVTPYARRKQMFWGMVVYLIVFGVAVVFVAGDLTRKMIGTAAGRREVEDVEARAWKGEERKGDIESYARSMEGELRSASGKLKSIDNMLGKRRGLARVLGGLISPLPQAVKLSVLLWVKQMLPKR